ncbi:MAG: GNAT family N-acetyltransferase [Sphingomonadaceae bacterium]|nr:GNAT family N-acetyltransferase [Sphingomonadaceae bacterium]
MTVEVKLFDSLEAVARDADGCLGRTSQPKLYDRLEWFERTAAHCGLDGQPLVARGRNQCGSAWLFLNKSGSRAEALASWYTLDFGLIGCGRVDLVAQEIAKNLRDIAIMSLSPLGDPHIIAKAFQKAGWRAEISQSSENWYIHPPADFESYWQSRPSRLRNTVKRKAKKANLGIRISERFEETLWADYRAVYAQSWKPDEGSWEFMEAFARAEAEAGTLRLGVGYIAGEPVAAQLWTIEHGAATIHKLAYAESAKKLSPGSILGKAMFEYVIDKDHPEIIDYGTGSEPYKADWMDEVRPLYRLDLYNIRHPASWFPLAKRGLSGLVGREKRG